MNLSRKDNLMMPKPNLFFISLLLLISSYSIQANSQNSFRLRYIRYENSSGERGLTKFFYSEEGRDYKTKWQLADGSRYSVNYHFLNKNNQVIRKYREFSDSITSNNFYRYNKEGQLIEDYFERSDGTKGIVWYHYEDGKKVKAICRGLNGWFYGVIKYVYDDNQIRKGIIYQDGKEVGYMNYQYNIYGDLTKEHWDFDGKWSQTFRYEYESAPNTSPNSYTYSNPFLPETNENLVIKEKYDWNNEQEGHSIYEYEGKKLVRKVYCYDSLETTTSYEYDHEGLLMKSIRKYSDGRIAIFSYHYEDRKLVRRLFHGENGFVGSESYLYDEKGRLMKAKWKQFDTWLTGTINFQYDENNKLKTAFFKGEDDFDATIDFEYNSNQYITKIQWNFTFGKTQTYWFEYK